MHTYERKQKTKQELLTDESGIIYSRKTEANTVVISFIDGRIVTKYHDTHIVTRLNGRITLNSGGFRTMTTKRRLNDIIGHYGFYISQENSIWYIYSNVERIKAVFFDGIKISKNGRFLNLSKSPKNVEERTKKLKKKIKKFVDQITEDNIPEPESGDCLLCRMGSKDCLQYHLDENYLHGSLLVAAMKDSGYDNVAIHYQMRFHETFKRALRKYMQKNLLF